MPEYKASIVVDGWANLIITADNRAAVARKLSTGKMCFQLLDENHEPIGELDLSDGRPFFYVESEEIELLRDPVRDAYYAAQQSRIHRV